MPPNRHPTTISTYAVEDDEEMLKRSDATEPRTATTGSAFSGTVPGLTATTQEDAKHSNFQQSDPSRKTHVRQNSRGSRRHSHRVRRHGRSNSDIPTSVDANPMPPPHPMRHSASIPNGAPPPPPRFPSSNYGSIHPYTEGGISSTTPPRPRAGSFSSERSIRKSRSHRKSRSSTDPSGYGFSPQAEWRKMSYRSPHRRSESNGSYDGSIGEAIFTPRSSAVSTNPMYGVEQPLTCRNVFFLLLFVFHLILVVYAGQHYFRKAVHEEGHDTTVIDILYDNLIKIAAYSGMFAVLFSMLLLVIVSFATKFIQTALFLTISMSFLWGTIGIGISPHSAVPITGMIGFALSIAYAFIVWDRIPLSAANLQTGISGLRQFWSICCIAMFVQWMAWGYVVYYSVVVCGVYDWIQEQWALKHGDLTAASADTGSFEMTTSIERGIYALLAISFYWTLQVMQGTVQAITAAIIKGWWFTPKDTHVVSQAVFKTVFYSLGSICFGSLFVGPVRILRLISVLFRPSAYETSSLMVLHECVHVVQSFIANFVDRLSASINTWSYTYIGMFHYGFLEAGYKATEVFAARGWTTIVSDDLVSNVFFLTSLMIGGLTGCFAFLFSSVEGLLVMPNVDEPGLPTFVVGVVVGLVLPSIVFSVIISAVDAVLVCFASSPMVLEENHPQLSTEMREAWREVWPGALDDFHSAHGHHVRRRSSGRTTSLSPLHCSLRPPSPVYGGATNGMRPDMHPLLI